MTGAERDLPVILKMNSWRETNLAKKIFLKKYREGQERYKDKVVLKHKHLCINLASYLRH